MGELSDNTSCAQCVETYSLRKRWTISGTRMLNQRKQIYKFHSTYRNLTLCKMPQHLHLPLRLLQARTTCTVRGWLQTFSFSNSRQSYPTVLLSHSTTQAILIRLQPNKEWQTTFHTHSASQPHRANKQTVK